MPILLANVNLNNLTNYLIPAGKVSYHSPFISMEVRGRGKLQYLWELMGILVHHYNLKKVTLGRRKMHKNLPKFRHTINVDNCATVQVCPNGIMLNEGETDKKCNVPVFQFPFSNYTFKYNLNWTICI